MILIGRLDILEIYFYEQAERSSRHFLFVPSSTYSILQDLNILLVNHIFCQYNWCTCVLQGGGRGEGVNKFKLFRKSDARKNSLS